VIGIAEFVLTLFAERQTVEVGSFLIVLAAFGGLELYGLTGALLGMLGVIVLVAILDELRRADEEVLAEESELLITPPRE
jgi:predicted PurR-regulated permease PerM